jgi:predicted patatin/cPLA2 family phospholipase
LLAQTDFQTWQATHKKFQALEKHLSQFEKSWHKKAKKLSTPKKKKKIAQHVKSKQAKNHLPSESPETTSDVIYSSEKSNGFT